MRVWGLVKGVRQEFTDLPWEIKGPVVEGVDPPSILASPVGLDFEDYHPGGKTGPVAV